MLSREKAQTREQVEMLTTLTGVIYTGRDAAHKRMTELLDDGKPLPFPIEDAVIYYVGPTPANPVK